MNKQQLSSLVRDMKKDYIELESTGYTVKNSKQSKQYLLKLSNLMNQLSKLNNEESNHVSTN